MKIKFPNWLLTLTSLVIFFIFFEIGLALFYPSRIVDHPYHEQYHPVMGWSNKPNVSGVVHVGRSLKFLRTHNNLGLRSLRKNSYDKTAGRRRALLLGDSFFWGFGVNDKDIISEVLQRMADTDYEVINGSVVGYGTDQELLWLMEEGIRYRPDVVVLGLFPTNDTDEISSSVMYNCPKPYFTLEKRVLKLHNVPVPDTRETRRKAFEQPDTAFGRLKGFLRHRTHIYPFIVGRLNSLHVLRELILWLGLGEEFTTRLPGIVEHRLPDDQVLDLADALLLEIREKSVEMGAKFLVVHIPRRERTDGGPDPNIGNMSSTEWNNRVSDYLAKFTKKHRIDLLDLLPIVRDHEARGEVLYNRSMVDHHWTVQGNEVAAQAIAEQIRHAGW